MKAEKLNLNVSSTGEWHTVPKSFQFQWNCTSYRKFFQKNFCISYTTHLYHWDGKRQRKANAPGHVCWLCSLRLWDAEHPQQLLLFTEMTLHLHCDSLRTLGHKKPEHRELTGKGETHFKLGTASFRVWEVAEKMRRALGNNVYQQNLEWFGCSNWKRQTLNHNLVQIYKISRRTDNLLLVSTEG